MYELDSLPGLSDQQKASLRKAEFLEASEILQAAPTDLLKRLRLPDLPSVTNLIQTISQDVVPPARSLFQMMEEDERRWIGSGDEGIDAVLGGGIRRGVITEIAGESASGKSHMGLQLCVTSQTVSSPHTQPGGAILLTSERKISFTRMEELASHILASKQPSSSKQPLTSKAVLDNVHTMHITEVDGLDHALAYIVPAIISRISTQAGQHPPNPTTTTTTSKTPSRILPIRLLIIDSIGALFRSSFDSNHSGLTQRSKMLCQIADKLKLLAEKHDLAVVVINQVTDVFNHPSNILPPARSESPSTITGGNGHSSHSPAPAAAHDSSQATMTYKIQSRYFSGQSPIFAKEASLGLVWANAVNTRIMLSRTGRRRMLHPEDLGRKRVRLSAYEEEVRREGRGGVGGGGVRDAFGNPLGGSQADLGGDNDSFESSLIRRMHLVFSPFAKQDTLDYVILASGVHSLPKKTSSSGTGAGAGGKGKKRKAGGEGDGQNLGMGGSGAGEEDGQGEGDGLIYDDFNNLPEDFWSDEEGGEGKGGVEPG